jgi:hypothetical protein
MKKRRTFNLVEPTIYPPIARSEVLPYNNHCEVCFEKVTVNDNQNKLLKCLYCNVVCHESCFNSDPSLAREIQEKTEEKLSSEENEEKWKCFYCLESFNYEQQYYQKQKDSLALEKQLFKAQVLISKTWRKAKVSKVYRIIRIGIVTFQRLYHVYIRKKAFSQKRGGSLRVMKLTISRLSNLFISERTVGQLKKSLSSFSPTKSNNQPNIIEIYLLISIYDLSQGSFTQSWKMESQVYMTHVDRDDPFYNLTIDEDFILGGITSSQHIVITIFRKVSAGKEVFLGQSSLELGLAFAWKKGGKFSFPLGGSAYELRDSSGMALRCDYRFKPSGIIDFELCTSHGMTNNCCACYGTSVEEFLRIINKSSINAIGYTIVNRNSHNSVNNPAAGELNSPLLPPPLLTSRSSFLSPVSSSLSLVNDSSSIASSVTGKGSSISSLSRGTTAAGSPDRGNAINTTDRSLPMKKMWIAFYLEKLYIFSHYGDALKLIIDLKFLNMTYEFGQNKYKKNHVIYKIEGNKSNGLPDFSFYPYYDHDIFVMRCTIISMVMLAKKLIPFISLFPEVIPTSCRSPLKSRSADCRIPSSSSSSSSPKRGGVGGVGGVDGRRSSLATFFSAGESSRKLLKTPTARQSSHPYTNQFFDWKSFISLWFQFDALKKKALQVSSLTLSPSTRLKPLKSMSLSSFSNDSFQEPASTSPTSSRKTRLVPLSPTKQLSTLSSSFSFQEEDEEDDQSIVLASISNEKPERIRKSKSFLRRSLIAVPSPWSSDQLSSMKENS